MTTEALKQKKLSSIEEIDLSDSIWWQPKIERSELKKLMQRRDSPAWTHTILYFAALFGSGYIAYLSWGTWYSILAFFIYGTIYANSNSRWHEYGHRTVFRTRWLNDFFYEIGSFLAFFESVSWRWSHTNHHSKTRFLELDLEIAQNMQDDSLKLHQLLGCRHYSRVDFRLNENGDYYMLEINTLPGMTNTSLIPKAAKAKNISFDSLLKKIIRLAIK